MSVRRFLHFTINEKVASILCHVGRMSYQKLPVIDVIAPSDLPEGFTLFVETTSSSSDSNKGRDGGDVALKVIVPAGGVQKGELFRGIVLTEYARGSHHVPYGRWRDGLCACCKFGCCHPHLCMAIFCQPCAIGQILTRLKLTWCARPIQSNSTSSVRSSACRIMATIFIMFIVIRCSLDAVFNNYHINHDGEDDDDEDWIYFLEYGFDKENPEWLIAIRLVRFFLNIALGVLVFVVTMRARRYVRRKYGIPERCPCRDSEDCCCALCCTACTICQLARHTADYRTYAASYCSENGLPGGAPEVV